MKLAVIDLGTNTFHLLLAETAVQGFRIFNNTKVPVRIGQGGISESVITSEAQQRAMTTLRSFRSIIDDEGIDNVKAIATSAFRNAMNGQEFISTIYEETGFVIDTLSGHEEAELIYQGVNLALDQNMDNSLIMDIGGGSVEFILANGHETFWMDSFEIGAQRMMDQFHSSDPITPVEIKEIDNYLRLELERLWQKAELWEPLTLVGSSGTFDTLIDISYLARSQPKQLEAIEFELMRDDFLKIYKQITTKDRRERAAIPGMIDMRVDMIVVACCLIKSVLDHVRLQNRIRVSSYALKEGVLAAQLKQWAE